MNQQKSVRNEKFQQYWQELAEKIAKGEARLSFSDMVAIAEFFEFENMDPQYFPSKSLFGPSKTREVEAENLSVLLWGLDRRYWLSREQFWLDKNRDEKRITLDEGKDKLSDVVSLDILVRLYTLAFLFYQYKAKLLSLEDKQARIILLGALRAVNNFLENAVCKGYLRSVSVYSSLKSAGILAGSSGKYLPYPEKFLYELFTWLHRDSLNKEVYLR